jgi:intracellular sulfur oxidation DsrE/DsrF family protein
MGWAEKPLQEKLVTNYLQLLDEHDVLPAAICFYAEAVMLVVEGSPVLEQLQSLESKGVRLIVCNTCLNYYGLTNGLKVGIAAGMTDILEAQIQAEKVITL